MEQIINRIKPGMEELAVNNQFSSLFISQKALPLTEQKLIQNRILVDEACVAMFSLEFNTLDNLMNEMTNNWYQIFSYKLTRK